MKFEGLWLDDTENQSDERRLFKLKQLMIAVLCTDGKHIKEAEKERLMALCEPAVLKEQDFEYARDDIVKELKRLMPYGWDIEVNDRGVEVFEVEPEDLDEINREYEPKLD